jgi:O-antigen chain-terminating methyltransferase
MNRIRVYIALALVSLLMLTAYVGIKKYNKINDIKQHSIYIKDRKIYDEDSKELLDLLPKVEIYQPLYNVSLLKETKVNLDIKRLESSKGRAEAVLQYLGNNSKVKSLNILDIGSSLGYMDLYFGERGHKTYGIDTSENNIKISRLLAKLNQLDNVKFDVKEFNKEFVSELDYSYDIAFIFSVLHHIVKERGLEYAQDLMVELLDKTPLVFVELALKEEKVDFPWKESLPEDHLAVFAKCKDCQIELLGYFDTHLSDVKRPLYVVKKKSMIINGKVYGYDKLSFISYNHDSNAIDHRTRRYYAADDYLIKEVIAKYLPIKYECGNLISFYNNKYLTQNIPTARLYDWDQNGERIRFVFEKIKGNNLADIIKDIDNKQKRDIVYKVISIISSIEKNGLYYNDLRPWNFIVDLIDNGEVDVKIIDFDMTMPVAVESSLESLLWLMQQINKGDVEVIDFAKKGMREADLSEFGALADIAQLIIENKVTSMNELNFRLNK